ncbi:copper amine oxidase N-terminal domain-containing protein [Cohnella ginsengisoli]|uniref:Copper amine oxidase N-terminal domain-containing protein n=1 Tax=Cohnella ginsengisoli TaxID=425004 RepID=A0A9X4QMN7_9BACL|nr:stalk domain-containing protein [Cohnella ginsengisoli]MDG0791913.1 copper amine oxidase N-terminal domain-containing protein [Cohnella ginsengisoli]
MKKKIALGVLAFSLIAGTAYGANKGIQLVVNGQTVKAEAQIINGVTMVPVRAVGEALGGSASYDKANGRVTVTTPPAASEGLTLEQLNKIGESVGLVYVYDASNNLLGTGSGFITHGDVFVTNAHVAGIGSTIRVEFSSQDAVTLQTKDALFNDAKKGSVWHTLARTSVLATEYGRARESSACIRPWVPS